MILKKPPLSSNTTVVLPSSLINVSIHDQDVKPRISLSARKNDKSTSNNISAVTLDEIQRPISVSSFNLAREGEELHSLLSKTSTGDSPHHKNSKQQSTLTNSSPSIPKLLLKRFSLKQSSTTVQSTKPNAALSITDVSTSSSNTVATDHLLSTHSSISDQEERTSIRNPNKEKNFKDGYPIISNATRRSNTLKKVSRPILNQPSLSSNKKQRQIEVPPKRLTNNSLLTNSELTYENEATSDAWMKSHEDISQILIIDEQDEKQRQTYERKANKSEKNRMADGSRLMSFNLKARGDHQAHTIDSSRCKFVSRRLSENQSLLFIPSTKY
jgi:hypothetical protein